jgi:hypothetical protein
MEELTIKDKQKYLNDNFPFDLVPRLTDKKCCLMCDLTFTVGNYKVFKDVTGAESICCPNAPNCFGTAIDWIDLE